jgi:NAD(P)-dependent dehydrogenase (short-subunit alcohol dehydrogenase family)
MGLEIPSAGQAGLVTGARSGIGRAIAVSLGRTGASATLVGRDQARLNQPVALVEAQGAEAWGVARDLRDDKGRHEMVSATVERFGGPDVLVHSAAVWGPPPCVDTTLASFDDQWNVNVRASFALTQAALMPLFTPGPPTLVCVQRVVGQKTASYR